MKRARWIQKTHLFRADEFLCSKCESSFPRPYSICPSCGSDMKKAKHDTSWLEEAEALSTVLDDDW